MPNPSLPATELQHMSGATHLYHCYFTGLILTVASRRSASDAADWIFRLFRHQHHEKFLASFEKLGLGTMPHAVACAAYHYLSNSIGGVGVEFMKETDRKAWVRFAPPRWIYPGAAICGVPSEVSRAILHGWYAQNGVSLGNPRLGFVCTAQTIDGQHGLAGYFLEYERDLAADERLLFRPGELPPLFDAAAAPQLPEGRWPAERLAKASRNYAMEYIRTGLPRLVECFGPATATYLGRTTGQLIGAQCYAEIARQFGIRGNDALAFGAFMAALARGEGDEAIVETQGDSVIVRRHAWRLMRGSSDLSPAIFDAWNGLHEGALAVHNRFLVLEVISRRDYGDPAFVWRIRRAAYPTARYDCRVGGNATAVLMRAHRWKARSYCAATVQRHHLRWRPYHSQRTLHHLACRLAPCKPPIRARCQGARTSSR